MAKGDKPRSGRSKPRGVGRIEEGINLDVLMPERLSVGVDDLPGLIAVADGGPDKIPRVTRKRRSPATKVDAGVRVLRRGDVELSFLLVRRMFCLRTDELFTLYEATLQVEDGDISLGTSGEAWDIPVSIRVRCSVVRQMVMWVSDQRRSPWGPYERGRGVYDSGDDMDIHFGGES